MVDWTRRFGVEYTAPPLHIIRLEKAPTNCQFASRLGLGSGTAFPRQYMIVLQVNMFVTSPIETSPVETFHHYRH